MDIRQQITDEIVKAMEQGAPPWRKGWTSGVLAFNASSGKTYTGINQVILGMQGHPDPRYLTFKQAASMGLQVRKGAKGAHVVKMVEVKRKDADTGRDDDSDVIAHGDGKSLVMKIYTVFNATQIDGMAPMPARAAGIRPSEAVEAVIWGLQDTGMKLNFGGHQPAYVPRTDEIRMPVAADFFSLEDFQGTLLHEAAHASGHPKRMARLHLDVRLGTAELAREELRAELASAMMSALVGVPPGPSMIASHAGYLASWLEALRGDKGEIFRAAADAQRICDYLSELALAAKPREMPAATPDSGHDVPIANDMLHARKLLVQYRV